MPYVSKEGSHYGEEDNVTVVEPSVLVFNVHNKYSSLLVCTFNLSRDLTTLMSVFLPIWYTCLVLFIDFCHCNFGIVLYNNLRKSNYIITHFRASFPTSTVIGQIVTM